MNKSSKCYADESEDADIVPGCFVLRFEDRLRFMEYRSIWIRAEYIRIYNFVEKLYAKDKNSKYPVVILGKPGVGKTYWLFYTLRRCLAEKRPIIWMHERDLFLFVDEGTFLVPDDFRRCAPETFVWTLIDSEECPSGIPLKLVSSGMPLFIIYATTSCSENWLHVHANFDDRRITMNPWTREEIHQAALLQLPSPNWKIIDDAYHQLGPIPRLCIQKASDPVELDSYLTSVETKLKYMTLRSPKDVNLMMAVLTSMNKMSLELWLVNSMVMLSDIASVLSIMSVTYYMQNRLAIALQKYDTHEQIELYEDQASAAATTLRAFGRGMISGIFQAICHRHFQHQISIECVPMVRSDEDSARCKSQWHSSHRPFQHDKLEETRLAALGNTFTLAAHPSRTCEYSEDELWDLDFRPDIYYMADSQNQVAIDSFIWHDGHLYVFQFTACQRHSIHEGLLQRLAQYSPPHFSCRLVLVIPDEFDEVVCPSLQSSELQALMLFSSKVKV
ncbi:hypothetical protein BGW80DRAFT_1204772 [Lactifluus volemus]|nr:hypothetical protein BGW80DRAFT_1204772 [Lactifluus volemus]